MVVQTHSQNGKVIRNANIRTFDVYNPVWFVAPDMIKACYVALALARERRRTPRD